MGNVEFMSRFLTAHNLARYSAIHVGSRWKIQDKRQIKNTDNAWTKHNLEESKQRKTQQNKTTLV